MKLRLLKVANWLLLRLRWPFTDQHITCMPTWMMRIHLIPCRPFLWLVRHIDDRIEASKEI